MAPDRSFPDWLVATGMREMVLSFLNFECNSRCFVDTPPRKSVPRSFELNVVVHSAELEDQVPGADGGDPECQRPYVAVSIGRRQQDLATIDDTMGVLSRKETEAGDWSTEEGRWVFNDVIGVKVGSADDLFVEVACESSYTMYVASPSLPLRRLGLLRCPVSEILAGLLLEDRDSDGLIHSTPVKPFELYRDGRVVGCVHLSFETKTVVPVYKGRIEDERSDVWVRPNFCPPRTRPGPGLTRRQQGA